jgi:hypothetical protein
MPLRYILSTVALTSVLIILTLRVNHAKEYQKRLVNEMYNIERDLDRELSALPSLLKNLRTQLRPGDDAYIALKTLENSQIMPPKRRFEFHVEYGEQYDSVIVKKLRLEKLNKMCRLIPRNPRPWEAIVLLDNSQDEYALGEEFRDNVFLFGQVSIPPSIEIEVLVDGSFVNEPIQFPLQYEKPVRSFEVRICNPITPEVQSYISTFD